MLSASGPARLRFKLGAMNHAKTIWWVAAALLLIWVLASYGLSRTRRILLLAPLSEVNARWALR